MLEGVLRDLLPADIADRARGRVHVAVTRLAPPRTWWPLPSPRGLVRGELVTDFADRDDFISALLASCYIRASPNAILCVALVRLTASNPAQHFILIA